LTGEAAGNAPKASIGAIGEYAVDANDTMNRLYYKTPGYGTTVQRAVNAGTWVEVGGDEWKASWAAVRGTGVNPALTAGHTMVINGETIDLIVGTTITALVGYINGQVT
jgi:hypothetical protein